LGYAPLLREDLVYFLELCEPHRRLIAGHAEIKSRHLVIKSRLAETQIAQQPQLLGQRGVVRHNHATLARGNDLVRIEAEAGHIAKAAGHTAFPCRAVRLRAVFDDDEIILTRDRHDLVHFTGMAK